MKRCVLAIDVQNDFCLPSGSLYVNGALQDCLRMNTFMQNNVDKIDKLLLTYDNHSDTHISFCDNWVDVFGNPLKSGTLITKKDVINFKYKFIHGLKHDILEYLEEVKIHYVWNRHCVSETNGANFLDIHKWWFNKFNYETYPKGYESLKESYSAIKTNIVTYQSDINVKLLKELSNYDEIYVFGEAGDYCVRETLNDISYYMGSDNNNKFIIVEDCISTIDNEYDFKKFIKYGDFKSVKSDYIIE